MAAEWYDQQQRFRQQMDRWINGEIKNQKGRPWQGGHDEGTFAASWIEHFRLTRRQDILKFLTDLLDSFLRWAQENFTDGYWPQQEAHHGPEAFMIFLARMWHLCPEDERISDAFDNAAEHIGNWASDVPDWYDWDNHRFLSWSLGTEFVGENPADNYSVADHFKVAGIALVAYLATGKDRYLRVVEDFAQPWVQAILHDDNIPAAFVPIDNADRTRGVYGNGVIDSLNLSTEETLERHAAAGTMDTLMDLYELTGESRYVRTVRTMLKALLPQVAEPYADPAAPLFFRYRMITGDTDFDETLQQKLSTPEAYDQYFMMFDDRPAPHPMGLGRRKDAPQWGHRGADGSIQLTDAPSPAALMLLYQLTGNKVAAARAFDLAATRLQLALDAGLSSGRYHGCAGNTISSIAFGHGRSAGAGYAMTTLYPAAIGNRRFVNGEKPLLQFWNEDDDAGLPDAVAVLCRRLSLQKASVTVGNTSSSSSNSTTVILGPACEDQKLIASTNQRPLQRDRRGRTHVDIPPGGECELDIAIR